MPAFEDLLAGAEAAPVEGWDFSFLRGRVYETEASWRFSEVVRSRLAAPVLDMGTGGGEFFSSLHPFPGLAVATEAWPPNVGVAAHRLRPLDVHVVQVEGAVDNYDWEGRGGDLPFSAGAFELVVNRHESFSPTEVLRVLRPGGRFLTQQVGGDEARELRELFGSDDRPRLDAEVFTTQMTAAGFEITDRREELRRTVFADVGAVAWYMKAIPWDYPGFTIAGSRELLERIDGVIRSEGGLVVHEHRILVEATKA